MMFLLGLVTGCFCTALLFYVDNLLNRIVFKDEAQNELL